MVNSRAAMNTRWLTRNRIWLALYRQGYDIRVEYKLPGISTLIDSYFDKPYYACLKSIYDFLLRRDMPSTGRNKEKIGHSGRLEDCDVFLACSNQVIELDEQHHFSRLRGEVLDMYPDDLPLAFNRKLYRQKCNNEMPAKAAGIWNDVLRDFLPWIAGINPTARIDVSAVSQDGISRSDRDILKQVFTTDTKLEFHTNRKGTIHQERDKGNVDEEKNLIYRYLLDRYDVVYWGYPTGLKASLNDYLEMKEVHPLLHHIYSGLEGHRGRVIKTGQQSLAPCDIYIPEEHRIVELDEFRHFSILRSVALQHYPDRLQTAFDREEYTTLCEIVRAKDDTPSYRDEQRAWYDTIRDFATMIDSKYRPVIRVPLLRSRKAEINLDKETLIKRMEDSLRI